MNLVVAIDDLHPEQGWGCEGDIQVEYLSRLNKQYGVKFTLFCPSYYHHEYKLTKDWVSYWKQFDWVAGHEQINNGIDFNTQYFIGADGIHETDNINLYGETFMFQSHIQGDWNDNVWNEKNYLHFQKVLDYLSSQYELDFKTISEIE